MIILFIILILLVYYHFIYQSILLPSFRLKLRFNLFKLRDRTRQLSINNGNVVSNETFIVLEGILNSMLNNLPYMDFRTIYEAYKYRKTDNQVKEEVKRRIYLVNHCENQDIKEIYNESFFIFSITILANSGGWGVFLLPLAILILTLQAGKTLVQTLMFMPNKELDRIIIDKDIALT